MNMNELHILHVGRADCTVMLLDTPRGRRCIVVDAGGCAYQGRAPLLSFLAAKGVGKIDFAVLTHLHQDHFGGFFQLIGRIPIEKMAVPCGDLVFDERVYQLFGNREYYREYHQIFSYLADCKTELLFPADYAGRIFQFGESVLRCLFTKAPAQMESVVCARLLCSHGLSDDDIAELLERHKRACNEDSSIWGLWHGGAAAALLSGDSTDDNMRLALDQTGTLHPIVQKLSHHGLGEGYFSMETQARLSPEILVVSTDSSYCNELVKRRMSALSKAGNSRLYYTCQGDFSYRF